MSLSENDALHDQLERLFKRALALSALHAENALVPHEDDPQDDPSENDSDALLATYLAASFVEDALSDGSFAARANHEDDLLAPLRAWLEESDGDAFERISGSSRALETLVEGIFALVSLNKVSTNARFTVGDRVMAVLVQEGAWHEAKVERVEEERSIGGVTYHVRFLEYGAPQTVHDDDIAFDASWDPETEDESKCRVCQRSLALTFHHLVPRETHSHVLRKAAKALVPEVESLYVQRRDAHKAKSRKDWLEVHGINVCRKCHSQIHRVESNISLALKFNTLERILAHPDIIRWRSYASKLK